jgi:hypothetical protein
MASVMPFSESPATPYTRVAPADASTSTMTRATVRAVIASITGRPCDKRDALKAPHQSNRVMGFDPTPRLAGTTNVGGIRRR